MFPRTNHGCMADYVVKDGDVGRSTTNVNQTNTSLLLFFAQHRELEANGSRIKLSISANTFCLHLLLMALVCVQ